MKTAVLRASLLVLASSVYAQSPTRSLGGLTPRAPRSSALLSTQDMFAFWCKAEREKSPLCQQHVRTAKLGALQKQILSASTDAAKKAELVSQRAALINEGKANPIASTRKEYLDMKEAYCASEPARSKAALCAHPTSRYQSLQTSRSAPSAITWYCAIAANVETAECKRNAVSAKLRGLSQQPGSSLEARKKLLEELKAHPFDYAKMQAIQADFCKVKTHADDYSCLRLKETQAQAAMQAWHCARPSSVDSAWCKRDQILKKLRVLSLTASAVPGSGKTPPSSPERTALLEQLRAISAASRRQVGGTAYSSISKELSDAKKDYCKLSSNADSAYCKPKPTRPFSSASRGFSGR